MPGAPRASPSGRSPPNSPDFNPIEMAFSKLKDLPQEGRRENRG